MCTTNDVPGRAALEVVGLVRGSSVRARHLGKDILAGLRNLVGGEVEEYTKLLAEAREQAIDRMTAEARARGGDAVVGVRISTSQISAGAAEILAYGTAVRLAPGE